MKIFLAVGVFLLGLLGGLALNEYVFSDAPKEPVIYLETTDGTGLKMQKVRLGEVLQGVLELQRLQKQELGEIHNSVRATEEMIRGVLAAPVE